MPTKKHKRKQGNPAKKNHKVEGKHKSLGLIGSHPSAFKILGTALIVLGLFFLLVGMQSDAQFGLAMLALISGTAIVIFANLSVPDKKVEQPK